jgi:hypothetical protein
MLFCGLVDIERVTPGESSFSGEPFVGRSLTSSLEQVTHTFPPITVTIPTKYTLEVAVRGDSVESTKAKRKRCCRKNKN